MERTVPTTANEEIDLYLRTMYSLLRTTAEVQIRALEEVHASMNSLLHPLANQDQPDPSAFIYSLLRLPACVASARSIILGQSQDVFARHGYPAVESWNPVSATARRRRCFYNGKDTLACFIASRSDIDDVIPALTAFQIEWNKIHELLSDCPLDIIHHAGMGDKKAMGVLAGFLHITNEDFSRLWSAWAIASDLPSDKSDEKASNYLLNLTNHRCNFRIRLLGGSLADYWRATRIWWDNIEYYFPDILNRPVYFISSNTHSIVNLLSGYALHQRPVLENFLLGSSNQELFSEWKKIQSGNAPSSMENFLYYILKKYQQANPNDVTNLYEFERQRGIHRIPSQHSFDVEAQIIEIHKLNLQSADPRLILNTVLETPDHTTDLNKSNAIIINVDYPLGLAAYNILSKIAEHANSMLGVYVMGKAATLNGVLGDVMIPNVVHDEQSQNTYLFQNAFSAADISPYLIFGSVLDNQKSVTVRGTFLQNAKIMDVFYREGYTDIEMEAGPYLSAIYEMIRPKRHPVNEIINLAGAPFDFGLIHYASDTPLSKGRNLGAGTLSYYGMDSTYAASIAILRRILMNEHKRLTQTL